MILAEFSYLSHVIVFRGASGVRSLQRRFSLAPDAHELSPTFARTKAVFKLFTG